MTKRAYLGLQTLNCTNSCTLLKIAKKWCAKCNNRKTFWSRAENAVLNKPVHFARNRKKMVRPVRKWQNVPISGRNRCFAQTRALCWKSLKSGAPIAKMTKPADLELKTLLCTNSCTLMKVAKKWFAQCKNDKTCWSRAKKTVLHKLVHVAKNGLKVVHPVRKWQNVLI